MGKLSKTLGICGGITLALGGVYAVASSNYIYFNSRNQNHSSSDIRRDVEMVLSREMPSSDGLTYLGGNLLGLAGIVAGVAIKKNAK